MIIKNKILDVLQAPVFNDDEVNHISNSIIKTIDLFSFEANSKVIIENSIVFNFIIHSCWFKEGLDFRGNHVINYVDYQMGGHNQKPILFTNNIFRDFFNFFDCDFTDNLILENNIFINGSNLLGNIDEGWKNSFKKELILKNNVGLLNMNGIGINYV